MPDTKINYLGDPWNSDAIATPKRCKSAYYSGSYLNITAPAAANFPEDDTAKTRYVIYLPFVPHSDLTTYPLVIRDGTSSTVLTRVTGAPGANEFRVAPSTSKRPHMIELHSGQAAHTIQFDGYAIGCVLDSDDYNYIVNNGSLVLPSYGIGAEYRTGSTNSYKGTRVLMVNIGTWDMDATASVDITVSGLPSYSDSKVVFMDAIIWGDVLGTYYHRMLSEAGTVDIISTGVVRLTRTGGGVFDGIGYDYQSGSLSSRGILYMVVYF